VKRGLHKCSLTLRHVGHTRTNGLFKPVEALLEIRFIHASFHTI